MMLEQLGLDSNLWLLEFGQRIYIIYSQTHVLLSEIPSGVGIAVEEEIVFALVPDAILESLLSVAGADGEEVVVGTSGLSSAVLASFRAVEALVTFGAAALVVVAGAALLRGTPVHRFPPMVVILNPACRGTL